MTKIWEYFNPKTTIDLKDVFSNNENSPLLDNYKEKNNSTFLNNCI